jgi:uncharacterized membrane protein YbaN (DUF454 family)
LWDPELVWISIIGIILGGMALAYLLLVSIIKLHLGRRRLHSKDSSNS